MEAKNIKIITPKKIVLRGFIFGPRRNQVIYILLHGLSGNLFSRLEIVEKMVGEGATVMVFNNRGYGLISQFRKINPRRPEAYDSVVIGKAHEVFTDCLDDIDGAINLALESGYKKIILIGHSTGCNKIAYYLSKKNPASVKAAVLLAPMSDYADFKKFTNPKIIKSATKKAQQLVAAGKSHELLSADIWPYYTDAQRFLSLFTPDSLEEIFSYAVPEKKPLILKKIKKPVLVVLAGDDQFKDRPMIEIYDWFKKALSGQKAELAMIKKALHGFGGQETKVKNLIFKFVKRLK